MLRQDAPESQFDLLVEAIQHNDRLPGRLVCVAGSGDSFHGFKNRPWAALPGNIHLSAYLRPQAPPQGFGAPFILLGVVSIIRTVDSFPALRGKARIKWVNDVLIEGKKVGGVLVRVQTQGNRSVGAVIGIGLNVEATPEIKPSPFVPEAGALTDFSQAESQVNERSVLTRLLRDLARAYRELLSGKIDGLLEVYRSRSLVIGRTVSILEDRPDENLHLLVEGKVESIGPGLELFLEGESRPIVNGRLLLQSGSGSSRNC